VNVGAKHPATDETDELLNRALEATEAALAEVTKLAIQRIRRGVDTPPHLEAAERELRNALRQLASLSRESRRGGRPKQDRSSSRHEDRPI
jgi:hypothetical protein